MLTVSIFTLLAHVRVLINPTQTLPIIKYQFLMLKKKRLGQNKCFFSGVVIITITSILFVFLNINHVIKFFFYSMLYMMGWRFCLSFCVTLWGQAETLIELLRQPRSGNVAATAKTSALSV